MTNLLTSRNKHQNKPRSFLCSTGKRTCCLLRIVPVLLAGLVLLVPAATRAAELAPPTNLQVADHPDDAGTSLNLSWDLSPDDLTEKQLNGKTRRVTKYEIYRWTDPADLDSKQTEELLQSLQQAIPNQLADKLPRDWPAATRSNIRKKLQATLDDLAKTAAESPQSGDASNEMTVDDLQKFHDRIRSELLTALEQLAAAPGEIDPASIQQLITDLKESERNATDFSLPVGLVTHQVKSFEDAKVLPGVSYKYQVRAGGPEKTVSVFSAESEAVQPRMQFIDTKKIWFAVLLFVVGGSVVLFILLARKGIDLRIRRIAGLDAVEEAVGRATEMGREILFVPGIQDINDIQTVAGITVLSRVAEVAADYDAPLEVPTARSLVMTTARETVEAAFLAAGRPDAYREDEIYYLTDEQFGYVASVTGTMMRKEPAACFYMGAFYAESLLLAETGNQIGAIQVAGTAMPSQLPFFVAACDYVLIGEEFFAASAYLSGEPQQLGSLKGQDVGKLVGGILVVVAILFATVGLMVKPAGAESSAQPDDKSAWTKAADYLQNNVLGDKGLAP